jgi:hypothetical protein
MQKKTIIEMQKLKKEQRELKLTQLVEKAEKETWEELHFPSLIITERESRASMGRVENEDESVEYDI